MKKENKKEIQMGKTVHPYELWKQKYPQDYDYFKKAGLLEKIEEIFGYKSKPKQEKVGGPN